tara:strand:+ start:962 stop:1729 length:768 start_codon:yes stop_codon:yes gene_type:complete
MNNWVLILGASSGIGKECAIEFAKEGYNIYGIYLRKPKNHIEQLTDTIKSHNVNVVFKKANAANPDNREKIIEELKQKKINVKALIHSLAFGALKPFINNNKSEQLNKKNIDMTLDVMSNSLIYWTQELFQNQILNEGSQIISMTSAGNSKQWESYGAVSMAKAALESATRQLAFELAPYKIACNCIQAGVTLTPALEKIPGYEKMVKNAKSNNPHQKLTQTKDISQIAVMIGSMNNYWMTGNTIKVDGGESLTG